MNSYKSIQEDLEKNPGNLFKLRKSAYSSLFLGLLEDAYHWSTSLNFYGLPTAQKSRQKRIELFLDIKKPEARSQLLGGIVRADTVGQKYSDIPDEKIVWNLNPHRGEIIKKYMKWNSVSSKVIKIFTYSSPSHIKNNIPPFAYEPGADMNYPSDYSGIPGRIIGYWYYSGFIFYNEKIKPVVFRYPEYPQNDQEVEVFFEENSEDELKLSGGEAVACYFSRKDEVRDTWLECKLKIYSIFSRRSQQFGKDQSFYQGNEKWGLPGQRPTMLRLATYGLEKWLRPEDEVLDIGCNIGCLGIEVAKNVKTYTGFDNNPDLIEISEILSEFHAIKNCHFLSCDFNDFLGKNNKKYDFVFSFAVHSWIGLPMNEYAKILKSMIKPEGFVLVESHDLKTSREKFMKDMRFFIEEGFVLMDRGDIKDDDVIARSFFIFKNTVK